MAEPTFTDEALGQTSDESDQESLSELIDETFGKPTYQVISRAAVQSLRKSRYPPKFFAGWWYDVRIIRDNPRTLYGQKTIFLNIPDELESPATLKYMGFRVSAIPVLWTRYLSIVKGGYKPYDLWDFVSSCIIPRYPKDAHNWNGVADWVEIWDGLQLDNDMAKWLQQRLDRQENFKETDRSCKSCVLWIMKQRWNRLCNVEQYTIGGEILRQ